MLDDLGFRYDREHPVRARFGSSEHTLFADYVLHSADEPFCVIESKLQVADDADRDAARDQARSYAVQLGAPTVIVAAPEGLWLYEITLESADLHTHIPGDQIGAQHEPLRDWLAETARD